jgi:type I restriction enzyme S subunit
MANDWRYLQLKDVIDLVADNRGRNPESYSNEGIPVIDNYLIISEGYVNLNEVKRCVDESTYESFIRKHIQENDVLITLVGNGYGQVALTPSEKCVIIQNTIGLRCNSDNDNIFLYYLLKNNRKALMNLNIGAAQPSIKVGNLTSLEFQFPPLAEQKAIAHILGSLDDKIELNRQMNETLDAMAQEFFKSWFVDFDPVIDNALAAGNAIPDEFAERAAQRKSIERKDNLDIHSLFPDEFELTEEIGWIPKGWENGILADICSYGKGKINTSELTLENYVSTENMNKEKSGISHAANIASTNQVPKFSVGQTLISNIRPYFKKIWLASFSGGRSNDVLSFQAHKSVANEYLFNLLYQDSFFDYMTATSKGTKMPRGDKAAIMSWSVAIPSSKLMEEFSELAKPMYLANNLRSLQTIELAKLRDTLLPKLMSGELLIPDAARLVDEII